MRTLIAMNEVGCSARFLPEWEHIVCRWQHVDVSHLHGRRALDLPGRGAAPALASGDYEKALPGLTAADARRRGSARALFLGCLFHDIGKGFGGDHSPKGAVRARALPRAARRSIPELIERVVFLVQRAPRDVAHRAAPRSLRPAPRSSSSRAGRRPHQPAQLSTCSPSPTCARRRSGLDRVERALLRELFERTAELLETGERRRARDRDLIERRVETRRQAAPTSCAAQGVAEAEDRAASSTRCRSRYFVSHAPRADRAPRAVADARTTAAEQIVVTAVREMRGGFTEFILVTRDVHGLYSNVAGVLTAHRINILGVARLHHADGLALEVYRVATPAGGEDRARDLGRSFEEILRSGARAARCSVERSAEAARAPDRRAETPSRTPPRWSTIANDESDFYTIVDVLGERSARPAPRPHAHDRRARPRDLHLEGGDGARPGRRHLLPEGRAKGRKISDDRSALEALRRDLLAPRARGRAGWRGTRPRCDRAPRSTRSSRTRPSSAGSRRARSRPTGAISRGFAAHLERAGRARGRATIAPRALARLRAPRSSSAGSRARSRARALVAARRFGCATLARAARSRAIRGGRARRRARARRLPRVLRPDETAALLERGGSGEGPLGAARPRDARGALRRGAARVASWSRCRSPRSTAARGWLRVLGQGPRERHRAARRARARGARRLSRRARGRCSARGARARATRVFLTAPRRAR